MTENDTARATAEQHSKQGTFSFLDRLNSRNYPTEKVEIYLDEATGHEIEKLQTKIAVETEADKITALEEKLEVLREKARESRFIFHLEGISSEEYDATVDLAQDAYPLEYTESRNPITFKLERDVIQSDQREHLFRTELWAKFVRRVEDPDGNVDDNITPEFMAVVLGRAPIAAQAAIGAAINELRMVTNWMDQVQGEDFLAKS